MGNFLNSLFGSSQSSSYQPPEILKNTITDLLTRAGTQSQQPYPQYTPDTAASYSNYNAGLLAPLTPNQAQAGQSIAGLQGYTAPNFGAATGLAAAAANPLQMQQFSQGAVNQYMNPYMNDVVNSAVANINQTNAQQQQQVLGNAIQRGAFGGDRAGIAQAELARQQGLANNATIANLLGQGYSQAQQQFNQQQQTDLATQLQNRTLMANAANNLANLGTQGQQAALQQAQAQYGYGTAEQQQQQAGLSTAYQQYLNQQMYPYQQLGWYGQLASGTAPSLGGTSTITSPTYGIGSLLGQIGTLGTLGSTGQASSNPFATAMSGIGNVVGTVGGLFGLPKYFEEGGRVEYADGGRTGYADGGNPTSRVTQAYNDYINAISSGAPYPVLQAAYKKYQQAFQGAPSPFGNTASPATVAAAANPTASTSATTTDTSGRGGGSSGILPSGNDPRIATAAYPEGGREIIEGEPIEVGPNQTLNSVLKGNAPLITGDYPKQQGILSGLMGGVDSSTGMQTGLAGAFDALLHGNSPGTLNHVLNAQNKVAYGERADGTPYPNTTSGMTAQEFADKFTNGDLSKVSGGIVNGQIDWFNNENGLANALHFGAVPASKLTESIGPVTTGDMTAVNAAPSAASSGVMGFRVPGAEEDAAAQPLSLTGVNATYGLPVGYMEAQAQMESGLNPNAKNPYSSASGLYQIVGENAQKAGIDPFNAQQSANWTGANASANAQALRQAGIPITGENLALAHQWGAPSAIRMLQNPEESLLNALSPSYGDQAPIAAIHNKLNVSNPSSMALDDINARYAAAAKTFAPRNATPTELGVINTGTDQTNVNQGAGVIPGIQQQMDTSVTNPFGFEAANRGVIASAQPAPVSTPEPSPSAASEGHGGGGGGLDRTVSAPDNSSNETGGSFGSRGNGPSVSEHEGGGGRNNDGGGFGGGGEGASGRSGGAWKTGGFVHPHHYADGGFAPITMQYGMPTEADLGIAAQSLAGSGAGVLPFSAQALAAKGVLPSATGGRIHKQDAGSVGADYATRDPSDINERDPAADQEEYENKLNDIIQSGGAPTFGGPTRRRSAIMPGSTQPAIDDYTKRVVNPPEEQAAIEKMQTTPRTAPIIPKSLTPDQVMAGRVGFNTVPAPAPAENVTTDTFAPTPSVTPKVEAPVSKADMPTPNAVPAQARYTAPPPEDRNKLAALAYFAALGSPGGNLADAARAYAQSMYATQGQERATMTSQATAEQNYATAEAQRAAAQNSRIKQGVTGFYELYTGSDGKVHSREIADDNATVGELAKLPGFSGVEGQAITPSDADASLGPIYTGQDVPVTSLTKDQTLRAKGRVWAKQQLGTQATERSAQFNKMLETAQAEATSAQNTAPNISQIIKANTNIDANGMLAAGAADDVRLNIANYLNTAWRMSGYAEKYGDLGATKDNLVGRQLLEKFGTLNAQERQYGLGREAGFWLEKLKATNPSGSLSKETSNEILANMIVNNKMKQDRAAVYSQYGRPEYSAGMGIDAPQVFESVNPSKLYAKDIEAITKILNDTKRVGANGKPDPNGANVNVITALQTNRWPGGKTGFDKWALQNYGVANLSRYFQ